MTGTGKDACVTLWLNLYYMQETMDKGHVTSSHCPHELTPRDGDLAKWVELKA